MGIQLDWRIESEQQQQQATEDPGAKRIRRQQRRKLFFIMAALATGVCVVLGGILWRLRAHENHLRQDLLDTVDAEIRALKIGNEHNYLAIRRSGSDYWMDLQRQSFAEYQQLKNLGRLELTGNIIDVEMDIDERRARVLVEEKIDGVAYEVAWFYWLYTDEAQSGWRRVPPDIAFWGDKERLDQGTLRVEYYELDDDFARALAAEVGKWWQVGCQWLSCSLPLPRLTLVIEPRSPADPAWDLNDPWTLVLTSPLYAGRTRRDHVLSPELKTRLAQMVAERMVNFALNPGFTFSPLPFSDAEWLYVEFQRALIGRFTDEPARGSPFFETLVTQYGNGLPGLMLRALQPATQIGTLLQTTAGLNMPAMSMETLTVMGWSSFFEWRLEAERRILAREGIAAGQEIAFHNSLYDESDAAALTAASINRDTYNPAQPPLHVLAVNFTTDAAGNLLAVVNVSPDPNDPNAARFIGFRWVQTTWKRVS